MDKNTDKNNIRRYLNGTYMMSEVDELHDTLRHASEDGALLDEIASEVWEEAANERFNTVFAETKSYKEAQQLLRGLKRRHSLNFRSMGYAAIGIAASFLIVFFSFYWMKYTEVSTQQMTAISTSFGEKKLVKLPDGSRIMLNACSTLHYPESFEGDVRKVQLKGQAFFEIARDEEKPFMVEAGKLHVQVLGTEFDVKSYSDDELVSVEVKSGKVEVTLPEATLRLTKSEQILVNTVSGDFNKKKGNKEVASWRKGSLCFNSTPIRDVARELERIYNCHISFKEGQEFTNLISGEHDNQDLSSVLESLHFISGLNYLTNDDGSILIYK